jgi:uncharacterized membrane protein
MLTDAQCQATETAPGAGCANIPWHWLGTDNTTRDVLARVIYGFRISVLFGLILAAVSSLIGVVAGALLVTESRAEGRNRFDIAGTITVALGLASLVYGFTLAEQGWLRVDTLGFLLTGVLLLAVFVRIQARSDHPLLPLRIVTDRIRGGAFLIQAIVGSVMIGSTL